MNINAIIIGAGIAGFALARRLASEKVAGIFAAFHRPDQIIEKMLEMSLL